MRRIKGDFKQDGKAPYPTLMARTPLPVGLSYRGKTALVTGANTGLGYAVAALLLRHDISCLILGVRTVEKGESTKARLLQEPTTKARKDAPEIVFYTMDMLSAESVVEFSEQILTQVPKLDIAILNGGCTLLSHPLTS